MSPWFVIILLVFALLWALWWIWAQNRIVRGVAGALREGHGFLRDTNRGLFRNRHWREMIEAANEVLEGKKKLEADRAGQTGRMRATLASMQEAVLIVDDQDRVLLANDAFRRLFPAGSQGDEGVARVLRSSALSQLLNAVRQGDSADRIEIEFLGEGSPVWAEASGSRIPGFGNGNEENTLLILHDTTRLRRLEAVRKEFVANVSHELRTPLSLIKGYTETLSDSVLPVPEVDQRRFLGIIQKHTMRLERLVEDLLALSRLESGNPRLRKEKVDLGNLLRDTVESFRSSETTSDFHFALQLEEGLPLVNADTLRIAQVMGNLLENAIKYSGGSTEIEAGMRREGDVIKTWVRDRGIGISPDDLPHVFERFYRVDKGRSRESGGTGLGLSIVKHIVQLHGGIVQAESAPGQGTCIYFTLPVAGKPLKNVSKGADTDIE